VEARHSSLSQECSSRHRWPRDQPITYTDGSLGKVSLVLVVDELVIAKQELVNSRWDTNIGYKLVTIDTL